jgi:glutamyl-tRNA(Gln) amidotransferase subunit E
VKSLAEERNEVKIGLEIHFQVKGRKLFCECMAEESKNVLGTFNRKLTVVSGEKADRDVAALQESMKGKDFQYVRTDNSCLVEMDEEPPHLPGKETVETAIITSLILGCKIVDNIHFMRKIVIDGSNTSGFQRTGIIGLNGNFRADSKNVGIAAVTLEEEACKKLKEDDKKIEFSLDRLGIPLIEISTEPDITSPEEAREIAENIGLAVRQSKMIRREASSIRQDLNISIRGGKRVEIKGVQSLSQIEKVLSKEIERQESLIMISGILSKRNISAQISLEDLTNSNYFKKSEIIAKGLKSGKRIFAFTLPGLSGVLNNGKYRLGMEIADRLRTAGIGGLIHSDELPNYGIEREEKEQISKKLGCGREDAFGIVLLEGNKIEECIEIIQKRIEEALHGVPAETRGATDDGTRYLRPLPGSSRMYPETDIPLIPIGSEYMKEVGQKVPPTVKQRLDHLESLGIPRQEALNSLWKEYDEVLESFVISYGNPKMCAKFLSVVFSSETPDLYKAEKLIERCSKGNIPTESLEPLYVKGEFVLSDRKIILKDDGTLGYSLLVGDKTGLEDISTDFKFKDKSAGELKETINRIVNENISVVRERGESSFKLLMGKVMKEVRGQFEGKEISELLKEKIDEALNNSTK